MRVKNLLVAVGVSLVALELLLQLAALYVSWAWKKTEPAVAAGTLVLCVGDSFTFGLGSSDPEKFSYPSQLKRILAESENAPTEVINAGWPGQSSYQVLENLPGQLEKYRPAVVLILVGTNDLWHLPRRHPNAARSVAITTSPAGAFRLEWRTARLIALVRLWLVSRATPAPGAWSPGPILLSDVSESDREPVRLAWEAAVSRYVGDGDGDALLAARDRFMNEFGRDQLHWLMVWSLDLGLARADEGRVGGIIQHSDDETKARVAATYRSHLLAMIRAARNAGARPILLTYPFRMIPALKGPMMEVAQLTDGVLIDVFEGLRERIPPEDWVSHFAEGHLNDRGYALMAQIVAQQVDWGGL